MADEQEPVGAPPADTPSGLRRGLTYQAVLTEIVAKIKEEPFLFVMAIAALIVEAAIVGARLGSEDLRYLITVIAVLAVLVIAGYYIRDGMRVAARKRRAGQLEKQVDPAGRGQRIEVTSGAKLDGALQESLEVESQVISVKGKESSAKDLIQTSGRGSPNKEPPG